MKIKQNTITICILVGTIVFTVFGIYYFGKEAPVEDDLLGLWTTSEPRYAGRSFNLMNDMIILGTGHSSIVQGYISKIEKEDQGSKRLYVIYYDTIDGGEQQFSFYYEPTGGGKIRFKNQKDIVWNKIEGSKDAPEISGH